MERRILLLGNINWYSCSEYLTSQLTVVRHVEEPCLVDIPCLPPFEEIRNKTFGVRCYRFLNCD